MREDEVPALPKLLTAVVRAAPTSCSGLYTNACTQVLVSNGTSTAFYRRYWDDCVVSLVVLLILEACVMA
jgi:hypothetical protein